MTLELLLSPWGLVLFPSPLCVQERFMWRPTLCRGRETRKKWTWKKKIDYGAHHKRQCQRGVHLVWGLSLPTTTTHAHHTKQSEKYPAGGCLLAAAYLPTEVTVVPLDGEICSNLGSIKGVKEEEDLCFWSVLLADWVCNVNFSRINTMTVKEQTQNTSTHCCTALLPNTEGWSPLPLPPPNALQAALCVNPTTPKTGYLTRSQTEWPLFPETLSW